MWTLRTYEERKRKTQNWNLDIWKLNIENKFAIGNERILNTWFTIKICKSNVEYWGLNIEKFH